MIIIDNVREAYSIESVQSTMTVEDLMDILSNYGPQEKVYIRNDGGYTYSGVLEERIEHCVVENNPTDETFRQRLQREHPEKTTYAQMGCPYDYGYETCQDCPVVVTGVGLSECHRVLTCPECWDRVIGREE